MNFTALNIDDFYYGAVFTNDTEPWRRLVPECRIIQSSDDQNREICHLWFMQQRSIIQEIWKDSYILVIIDEKLDWYNPFKEDGLENSRIQVITCSAEELHNWKDQSPDWERQMAVWTGVNDARDVPWGKRS